MTAAFHARHEGFFDPTVLEEKRVLLIGTGSVGSELARLLARSGVRRFVLVDPDVVTASNLCRTVYVAADVGASKVDALARHLRAIRDGMYVDVRPIGTTDLGDDELETLVRDADLVLATTDHPPTQARLGALSYPLVPALFAGVYAKGVGGEVLWTAPDETPCYACVLGALRGANAPPRGRTDYGLEPGTLAAEPALGIDILRVTVAAAKLALALLLRGTGSAVERILDPSRTVLFAGNAVDWIWQEPLETVWARAERQVDCVCRLGPHRSTADLFTDDDLVVS